MVEIRVWRHPRAKGSAGRCIGHTDLAVDARKAKRLAHRVRQAARREGLAREVWVSPLRRSQDVGRWLRRWGWALHVDARLCELDFGRWEGRPWSDIAWPEVEAWQAELLHHAPGGAESLHQLAQRARAFAADARAAGRDRMVVGHGGWVNALHRLPLGATHIDARQWPAPPAHGSCTRIAL
jgi:alpha-ribazole phosphatase